MRKIWIALVIVLIGGCKDDDISLSKDFEGTFYSSVPSTIGVANFEWKISESGPKAVHITSKIDFKSNNPKYSDESRIFTMEGVSVESKNVLSFNNKYSFDGEVIVVTGKGMLTGDKLSIDITETDPSGKSQHSTNDLYRR